MYEAVRIVEIRPCKMRSGIRINRINSMITISFALTISFLFETWGTSFNMNTVRWNVIIILMTYPNVSLQVVNFMSTDTDRVVNFCPSFHQFWSLPFQIAVSLYLLHQQVIGSLIHFYVLSSGSDLLSVLTKCSVLNVAVHSSCCSSAHEYLTRKSN